MRRPPKRICSAKSDLFVQDHSHGAIHTCIVSENSELEICIAGRMERGGFVVFLHCVKKDLSGSGDAASDNDDVGIYDAGDVRDRFAEHLAYRFDHGQGELISCLGIVENVLGRKGIEIAQRCLRSGIGFQGDMCQTDYARGRAVLLEAALLAASADRSLR